MFNQKKKVKEANCFFFLSAFRNFCFRHEKIIEKNKDEAALGIDEVGNDRVGVR